MTISRGKCKRSTSAASGFMNTQVCTLLNVSSLAVHLLIISEETSRLFFSLKSLANGKDVTQLQQCISTLREFAIDLPYRIHNQTTLPSEIDWLNSRCIDLHQHITNCWECQCSEKHVLYVRMCLEAEEDELNLIFAADGDTMESMSENSPWRWQPALFELNMGDSKSQGRSLNGTNG